MVIYLLLYGISVEHLSVLVRSGFRWAVEQASAVEVTINDRLGHLSVRCETLSAIIAPSHVHHSLNISEAGGALNSRPVRVAGLVRRDSLGGVHIR